METNTTVYTRPEGQTTQWEDLQRKFGNLPPKEPVWKPDPYTPEKEEVKDKEWIDGKDEDELSDLEDEFGDDQALEEYRCEGALRFELAYWSFRRPSRAPCAWTPP